MINGPGFCRLGLALLSWAASAFGRLPFGSPRGFRAVFCCEVSLFSVVKVYAFLLLGLTRSLLAFSGPLRF